jgi:sec-independent protein translocase protein TatA
LLWGTRQGVIRARPGGPTVLGSIGMQELIVILVIALLVFGPRRLPDLGRSLGRSITEFRRATNELTSTLEREVEAEEREAAAK